MSRGLIYQYIVVGMKGTCTARDRGRLKPFDKKTHSSSLIRRRANSINLAVKWNKFQWNSRGGTDDRSGQWNGYSSFRYNVYCIPNYSLWRLCASSPTPHCDHYLGQELLARTREKESDRRCFGEGAEEHNNWSAGCVWRFAVTKFPYPT